MDKNFNVLLVACGLYCGACYHYRASFYPKDRLIMEAMRRGQAPGGFACQGCRSDALYIHSGCAHCEIRTCTDEKGILHCGLCVDFPCERLQAFQGDGRFHHRDILIELARLREKGPETWLVATQAELWRCQCGERATVGMRKPVSVAGSRWLPTAPIRRWDEESYHFHFVLIDGAVCIRRVNVVKWSQELVTPDPSPARCLLFEGGVCHERSRALQTSRTASQRNRGDSIRR